MNEAHLHLMMNHLPVIGSGFALAFLLAALVRRNDTLFNAAIAIILFVALSAVPVFLTGEPAEEIVEKLPGVMHDAIESHEDAALLSLVAAEAVGVLALVGVAMALRGRTAPRWYRWLLLAGMVTVSGLMLRTAYLGGYIRHTEIRSGPAAVPAGGDVGAESEREDGSGRGGDPGGRD